MVCRPIVALVAVCLLTLGACREGAEIKVTQTPTRLTFEAVPLDRSFEPCITTAYLYAVQGSGERLLWTATSGGKSVPCHRSMNYAANPPGFSAPEPPQLKSQASYRVALLGPGFNESKTFVRN